jgi:hypothetical protein
MTDKLKSLLLGLLMAIAQYAVAQTVVPDSTTHALESSVTDVSPKNTKEDVPHRIGNFFTRYFKDFNEIDTNYIEPQHFNYAVMMQNTNTYETYRISSKSGQSVSFAPELTYRVGPYFGWRWIFLGYTFDINHVSSGHKKKEFDISLYSNLVSVDLYYRKTGNDYKIRNIVLDDDRGTIRHVDIPFSGLNVGIVGFDLYYVFNHKKFSYPAAFSQSTVQRRSCGSPLFGIGYNKHNMSLNHEKLQQAMDGLPADVVEKYGTIQLDSGLMFSEVKYENLRISGGYAYNWVFARNWLLAASLSVSLDYNNSFGDLLQDGQQRIRDFSFTNITFNGTGRLGIVWNNTRWFAGMSAIIHKYHYQKSQFSTNSHFGSLNFYVGLNFKRKR